MLPMAASREASLCNYVGNRMCLGEMGIFAHLLFCFDFAILEREDPEQAVQTISELVQTRLPRSYHTTPSAVQVLTPMQRGETGAANLNQVLQQTVNPGEDGLRRGGYLFRTHDKVMQIRNHYDKEVFNGDSGVVEKVDLESGSLSVRYDERVVEYDVTELDELALAYATTIHKSQGSEYPIVVMPLLMAHYVMLQRNPVYTGVTRAKRGLIIVGTRKALAYAVRHVAVRDRNRYCCRGCLEKWHGIPKGRTLSENERRYVVGILLRWIDRGLKMIEFHAETTARD